MKRLLWHSPGVCGCRMLVSVTNKQAKDLDVRNGEIYQFVHNPKKLEIVAVCPEHRHFTEGFHADVQGFFHRMPDGEYRQVRGYMCYPIAQPTAADYLYTNLYTQTGMTHQMDCGCVAYVSANRTSKNEVDDKSIKYHEHHPWHTKRCMRHHNDVGHDQALEECRGGSNVVPFNRAAR